MNGSKVVSFTSQGNLFNLREKTKYVLVNIDTSLSLNGRTFSISIPATSDMIGNQLAV